MLGAAMKYDWILDVISDLETFAAANDMPDLAAELGDLKLVAAADISSKEAQELNSDRASNIGRRPH